MKKISFGIIIGIFIGITITFFVKRINYNVNSDNLSNLEVINNNDIEQVIAPIVETVNPIITNIVNISGDEAKEKALSLVGGGTIIKYKEDLYYENGAIKKYKIEILYNDMIYKININAYTGNVEKFDVESIYD